MLNKNKQLLEHLVGNLVEVSESFVVGNMKVLGKEKLLLDKEQITVELFM